MTDRPSKTATDVDTDTTIEHPDVTDPVRFYLRRDGEIVGCGCSFPFPHDEIVVTQTTTTAQVDSFDEARTIFDADSIEFFTGDFPEATDVDWLTSD